MEHVKQENQQERSLESKEVTYRCEANLTAGTNRKTLVFCLLLTLGFVFAGTYSCASMGDLAVSLSWFLFLFPVVSAWQGYLASKKMSGVISEKQYKKGPVRLSHSGMLAFLFSGAQIFCCGHFLYAGDYESFGTEIGMLLRVVLLFVVSAAYAFFERKHVADYRIARESHPAESET